MQAPSMPNRDQVVTVHRQHRAYPFDKSLLPFFRPVFKGTGVDCAFFGNKAVLQASFMLNAGWPFFCTSQSISDPAVSPMPYFVFAVS